MDRGCWTRSIRGGRVHRHHKGEVEGSGLLSSDLAMSAIRTNDFQLKMAKARSGLQTWLAMCFPNRSSAALKPRPNVACEPASCCLFDRVFSRR